MFRMLCLLEFTNTERTMTHEYKKGEKSRAICHHCGLVQTTFRHRDVRVEGVNVHILTGVCDKCNQVVSIPAQATPTIKKALATGEGFSNTMPT